MINVTIIDDKVDEENEFLSSMLQLESDLSNVQLSLYQTQLTIMDDDSTGNIIGLLHKSDIFSQYAGVRIGIEMSQYTVNESDDKIQVCGIVKNETLERIVNFKLSTKNDSATSPADFSLKPVELQLNKMRSKACTNISIAKDKIIESQENFTLMMTTNDTKVIINTSEISTITITDADKVEIEFEREKYRIEEGKIVTICAALKNATLERDLTIWLRDGANTGTTDYGGLRETLQS